MDAVCNHRQRAGVRASKPVVFASRRCARDGPAGGQASRRRARGRAVRAGSQDGRRQAEMRDDGLRAEELRLDGSRAGGGARRWPHAAANDHRRRRPYRRSTHPCPLSSSPQPEPARRIRRSPATDPPPPSPPPLDLPPPPSLQPSFAAAALPITGSAVTESLPPPAQGACHRSSAPSSSPQGLPRTVVLALPRAASQGEKRERAWTDNGAREHGRCERAGRSGAAHAVHSSQAHRTVWLKRQAKEEG
ncbi:hypothetical protein [Oryza sativa Japonica Group]|uniref:Uncharacterized protein n=1 Tax=Oryza sativa subsp. japonica TaxID=39947 RepID=Q5QLK1_ORYSJ|nr:hypothetical protein [Oryza sativa Japonica Group]BAD73699.1 hypothetical protein [Oryza sativa Japonica Group]